MNETGAATDPTDPGVEQSRCCEAVAHSLTETELAADLRILTAAGSETRYEVLRLVAAADGGVCVCELEPSLGVSQGAISQALSRLYTAGLVSRRKEGRWRYYTATPRAQRLLELLDDIRTQNNE
ncbi:ArsR family transcriptional regulator [Halalkaliarchaeum desulfuricum]|uniref:ArsR family transcriptional regulator n=1 Tax=Halalkaliarchaeum desulfuricum TaxID=2055893 RepID=A0A343TKA4_9EURY|nr:metalloregulator ArsR/SmtB family transcription factor [Halalkaliarchaeum desulfuricum]AUX09526.1 ArsR family transcriptional regulator [Halalkaliarchaeum desulfuricum]